ncbi:MAG: hypothetical protein J0L62_09135 [Bacteroidetes bacterium]|nr:hypothetical protein [Bacteroidota bacterium]
MALQDIPKCILIFHPGHTGETIRTDFFFKSVREQFPAANITLITRLENQNLLKYCLHFNELMFIKSGFEFISLLKTVRKMQADLLIDLSKPGTRHTYYLAKWGRVKQTIGFQFPDKPGLFTQNVDISDNPSFTVAIKRLAKLAEIKLPSTGLKPHVTIGPREFDNAKRQLLQANSNHDPVIAVNLSASSPDRYWKVDLWWKFLLNIQKTDKNVKFLLLSAASDAHISKDIATPFAPGTCIFPAYSDIQHLAAYLVQSDLLISADSWVLDIAESFRIPAVAIYPEVLRNSDPYSQHHSRFEGVYSGSKSVKEINIEAVYKAYCRIRPEISRIVN